MSSEAALWNKLVKLQLLVNDMVARLENLENGTSGSQSRLEALLSVAENN